MTIQQIRKACEQAFQNNGCPTFYVNESGNLRPSFQSPRRSYNSAFPDERVFTRRKQSDGKYEWEEVLGKNKPTAQQIEALKQLAAGKPHWKLHTKTRESLVNKGLASMTAGITPLGRRILEANK